MQLPESSEHPRRMTLTNSGLAEIFEHPTLDVAAGSSAIRIFRVLPGSSDSPIECEMWTIELKQSTLYAALSYTWGDKSDFQDYYDQWLSIGVAYLS
jgi:hypothetical protein